MEMIYPHKDELLSEYWAMFSRLWDWESATIYTTAEAACIAYTDTANTAGENHLCRYQVVRRSKLSLSASKLSLSASIAL